MRGSQRSDLEAALQGIGLTGKIQTAYIERLNLTLRHLVAALSRRTWALAHTVQGLRWRLALGVTGHCWSVQEFITHPVY